MDKRTFCPFWTSVQIQYRIKYNLYFRDINLTSSESPPASKIAPNGDFYTALLFLDFNSMYLWSQMQDMPLGPGLRWKPSKRGFFKKVLQEQTSFSAVQWLQYEQTKYNVQIQHAYHQGEKLVYGMYEQLSIFWTVVHFSGQLFIFWTVVHMFIFWTLVQMNKYFI